MTIAIEFDGVIFFNGKPVPYALDKLREIQQFHNIILYTSRKDKELYDAEIYLYKAGIRLYGINTNPDFPGIKPKVDLIIDPACYNIPIKDGYIDWLKIKI